MNIRGQLILAVALAAPLGLAGCSDKLASGQPPPMATGTPGSGGKLEIPKRNTEPDKAKPPPPVAPAAHGDNNGPPGGTAGGPPPVSPSSK